MTILSLLFRSNLSKLTDLNGIAILTFDATMSVKHDLSATLTKSQIEDGSNISDHVTKDNKKATFDIVISNTPLSYLSGLTSALTGSGQSRSAEAYDKLTKLRDNSTPFNAVFGNKIYKSAIITNISVNETVKTSGALEATITIEEPKIVTSQMVSTKAVPKTAVKNLADSKSDLGKQSTTLASTQGTTTALSLVSKFIPALAQ